MEFLIVRLADIEKREDITDDQGKTVGAEIKFQFLDDRDLFVGGDKQGKTNKPGRSCRTCLTYIIHRFT